MSVENLISERLGGVLFGKQQGAYKFAIIKEAKARARLMHPEIPLIDMGVGEPDMPADHSIVQVLSREAGRAENRFYSDNGIPEFNDAAAQYLEKVFGLKDINSDSNVLHGIGSKPILAMLPAAFINPGDITLATVPGYPVLSTWTRYFGGNVYALPLTRENDFYPDLDTIPGDVLKRAKLLYINYPNNPTGQTATKDFYRRVVDFASRHGILVVSDAAYGTLTYDGEKPLSFLSLDGAMEVGVEIHSLSKAFNMTGWRMAFLAGNAKAVSAYGTVKDHTDSGQFRAIQKAGIYAMQHPELTEAVCRKYSRRMDLLVEALKACGFDARKPKGSFYCYVPCPVGTRKGIRFQNACDVSTYLIENAHLSVVPWDDAGPCLRFSVTFEAASPEAEEKVIQTMKERLMALDLVF